MTDITSILKRIRVLAKRGCDESQADDDEWYVAQFASILHSTNRLEAAMTTDTTDEAQWWNVRHEGPEGLWSATKSVICHAFVEALHDDTGWVHESRVHCPRADAEQAAVDAWADAGFQHAPKEPPGPKRVEVTGYAILPHREGLSDIRHFTHPTRKSAEQQIARNPGAFGGYRIVKVVATVSEVDE